SSRTTCWGVAPPNPFLLSGAGPLPAFSSSITKSAAFFAGTPKGAAAGPEMNATMPILTFCAAAPVAAAAASAAVKATASLFTKLMMSLSSFGSNILTEALFGETHVRRPAIYQCASLRWHGPAAVLGRGPRRGKPHRGGGRGSSRAAAFRGHRLRRRNLDAGSGRSARAPVVALVGRPHHRRHGAPARGASPRHRQERESHARCR